MIPDPSSPKIQRYSTAIGSAGYMGLVVEHVVADDGPWVKWSDVEARLAQLEQQLAAANDERRALKLAVFDGDEAKMQTFPLDQILRLIACYREDTEIMDALHEEDDEAGVIALRARLQAKEQRIAQLAQEQATLKQAARRVMNCDCLICCACSRELEAATGEKPTETFDWRPIERSPWEVTFSKEVEERIAKSEAALGETRQALQQLTEKHETLLSRVGGECLSDRQDLPRKPPTGEPIAAKRTE